MELSPTELKLAIQTIVLQETRFLFMSEYRAYWLPVQDGVPNNLKEEDLERLSFEEFKMLSELIAERKLAPHANFGNTLFGETCYQVFEDIPYVQDPQKNTIKPYTYSADELNILRAVAGEAPLSTPQKGGYPIKDIEGFFQAEKNGEETKPFLDMENPIPPHTVKEAVNGLGFCVDPLGEEYFEWYVGDWGTEIQPHPDHAVMIRSLIDKGILRLSPQEEDTRYGGTPGKYQRVYF